jgi:putative membrane protein
MDDELEPGGDWGDRELLWSMHGDVGWGGWLVIVILLLLLAALVIAVVLALLRSLPGLGTADAGPARQTEAELLLDERYARGEIDEIEYLHRRAVLRGG